MSSQIKPKVMPSPRDPAAIRLLLMAVEYQARVGARIRKAREAKDWTQARLARELPGTVDGASVSRWERGKVMPQTDTLNALADALGVDTSYFLVEEPKQHPPNLMGQLRQGEDAATTVRLDQIEASVRELHEKVDALMDAVGAKPPGGDLAAQMQRMAEQFEEALSPLTRPDAGSPEPAGQSRRKRSEPARKG